MWRANSITTRLKVIVIELTTLLLFLKRHERKYIFYLHICECNIFLSMVQQCNVRFITFVSVERAGVRQKRRELPRLYIPSRLFISTNALQRLHLRLQIEKVLYKHRFNYIHLSYVQIKLCFILGCKILSAITNGL